MTNKQESWEVEFDRRTEAGNYRKQLRKYHKLDEGDHLLDEEWYPESPYELEPGKVKDFIRETLAKRDAFWESQEMGVSHDCKKHEEEAVAKERERVVEILEALPVGLSEEYIGNHSIVRCVDINRVIALITKEV